MKRRQFTLVEIMVALAMLMVIMSFLFEFVISSQRIWRASEKKMKAFDNAQTIMDVVGDDIRNMRYSNEYGHEKPFYRELDFSCKLNGETDTQKVNIYMMVTQFKSAKDRKLSNTDKDYFNAGFYPVFYVYAQETNRLYRVALERNSAPNKAPAWLDKDPWLFYGVSFHSVLNQSGGVMDTKINDYVTMIHDICTTKLTEDDILAENVNTFDLRTGFEEGTDPETGKTIKELKDEGKISDKIFNSKKFAVIKPTCLQIMLSIDDTEDESDNSDNERGFTKTIFID